MEREILHTNRLWEPKETLMPLEATNREINDQPRVIERALVENRVAIDDIAEQIVKRESDKFLLVGSGDSWFAAQAVQRTFREFAGVPAEACQSYEFLQHNHEAVDPQTVVVPISSSGREGIGWRVLECALAGPGLPVVVTDAMHDDNPYLIFPEHKLLPGAEKRGMPTQTTTATMAVLTELAISVGMRNGHLSLEQGEAARNQLGLVVQSMEDVIGSAKLWALNLNAQLPVDKPYLFFATGSTHAVAQMGEAMLAEGPQIDAKTLYLEEFQHALRFATISSEQPVILLDAGHNTDYLQEIAQVLQRLQAVPIAIGAHSNNLGLPEEFTMPLPVVPESFKPLLHVLPLQQLSLALAANRVQNGHQRPQWFPHIPIDKIL